MSSIGFPYLNVFLGIMAFGFFLIFCTTFCRVCSRYREEQIQREVQRRSEQEARARNIYFIPFPRNLSHQDVEDSRGMEHHLPPQPCGPPPSYNELGIKPEDLPPAYSEHSLPVYPITPPPPLDMPQSQVSQVQSQH